MGMSITNHENKTLVLGSNFYETGVIAIAAGVEIAAGTLLKRASGKFAKAASTDTPVAVMPLALKNTGAASADIGFRALVCGMVRRDMLNLSGAALTDAQCDALRGYGIVPVKVTDISQLDNQ